MRKFRKFAGVLTGLLLLSLVAAACGDDGTSEPPGSDLTGSISVSGSSTVLPISNLVAETFQAANDGVSVRVDGPGTGDGFALFCTGDIDIADASRPIDSEEEVPICEENGIEYVELEVALDGLTVMSNPENTVECLNNGDLYALFGPESTGIDTWNGADSLATEVGGNGGFPDQSLEITAPGEESGTYDSFIDLAGIEDIALEQGVPEDDAASLRSDYTPSADDNVIITAMESSAGALGFVGFAYAQSAGEGVTELQIDGGEGCVAPTPETIADGSYSLSRSLYIYVNTVKAADSAALAAFVDYYLSEAGMTEAVAAAGYVTLPADRVEATQAAWAAVAPAA
ncbi:MAG: substrate-binding domain-containing protein [Actinomycetota bacterium]